MEPSLQQVLEHFPEGVALVVKPFPSPHHQPDWLAASAALAAHAQGTFWPFREQLFQLGGVVSNADLRETAAQLELDLQRFYRDLASAEIQNLLSDCVNDGVRRGVVGTPTVFVNQSEVVGLDRDSLLSAVESSLASESKR